MGKVRLLADVLRAFASSSTTDLGEVANDVARRIGAFFGDACALVLVDGDGVPSHLGRWAPDDGWMDRIASFLPTPGRGFVSGTMTEAVYQSGRIMVGDEATVAAIGARLGVADIGVRGTLVAPIALDDARMGVLVLLRYRADGAPYAPDDVDLVAALAEHAALAVSRARLREAEAAAAEAQRLLFDASPAAMLVFDVESRRIVRANDAALSIWGYAREELYSLSTDELRVPEERASIDATLRQAPEAHWASSARHVKKDGSTVFVQGVSRPLPNPEGRKLRLSVVQDVTLAERLAEQVRRNQKMDAIGSLAGGVAHDFNNLLSIILTSTSLILERLPGADPLRDEIEQIQRAGERASELTRRLLAFGRQQILSPRVVSISQVVRGVEAMARRLVGEAIEITLLDLAEGANVRVDPSQLEQVVMNLVANARDAMREGGRLTIEIVTTPLDETYAASHHGVVPGEYVMLAVTDTGVGMPPEVQQRMFEPFFTTKRPGDGTGLGLATVFGIVKQSGGHVWVYSEVGKGSTFKVYLPRVHQDVEPVVERAPAVNLRGTETILLVEDEDAVRKVIRTVLIRQGYNVLEARNGGEALLTCERYGARIHLLLTDVVMPQMSGRELAERLAVLRPEMRVLYVSGYTENSIVHNGVLDAGIAFLQKPIVPGPLCRKVREVLDAAR